MTSEQGKVSHWIISLLLIALAIMSIILLVLLKPELFGLDRMGKGKGKEAQQESLDTCGDWLRASTLPQGTLEYGVSGANGQWSNRVDWKRGYMEVAAFGTADKRKAINLAHSKIMALHTARALAYEKIAETINGLSLNGYANYQNAALQDSSLRTEVQGVIKGAQEIMARYCRVEDGSVMAQVTMGIWLKNMRAKAVRWSCHDKRRTRSCRTWSRAQKCTGDCNYTGLIVSVPKHLNARPAMSVQILAQNGDALYTPAGLSINYISREGTVGYTSSEIDAKKNPRVGKRPLLVNAVAVQGGYNADLIVSDADAKRIINADAAGKFLSKCRVMIVLP
jgi:hypothetical protein